MDIKVIDEAKQYIKLQRTHLSKGDIGEAYPKDIIKDYEGLKNFLPEDCSSIVDIGCGLAGIDIMLYRHFNKDVQLHLVDKTKVEKKVFYGFKKRGAFYNSLEVAKKMLIKNNVEEKDIRATEVEGSSLDCEDGSVDLVISLLSWGFHYPIATYASEVKRVLSPNGKIIVDVRKKNKQLDVFKENFKDVEIVENRSRYLRVVGRN